MRHRPSERFNRSEPRTCALWPGAFGIFYEVFVLPSDVWERTMTRNLLLVCALLLLSFRPISNPDDEAVESLKSTEARRLAALNARDVETVVEIEGGAVGFGWASTVSRKNEPVSFKSRLERWFGTMEHFEIELKDVDYRVFGNTGLVIGTLVRKESPLEGEPVTRRLRYSATYVREGTSWRMVQYHRSPMPAETTS